MYIFFLYTLIKIVERCFQVTFCWLFIKLFGNYCWKFFKIDLTTSILGITFFECKCVCWNGLKWLKLTLSISFIKSLSSLSLTLSDKVSHTFLNSVIDMNPDLSLSNVLKHSLSSYLKNHIRKINSIREI